MRVLAVVTLAGCFYQGGYHNALSPFPGKRVELPCLDLAVAMTEDARAPSPIVQYSFGNRCWHSTTVDLVSIHAIGYYDDGHQTELKARDPKQELAVLPIDAQWYGSEEISYEAADGGVPNVVCVDVGRVDGANDGSSRWVCTGQVLR